MKNGLPVKLGLVSLFTLTIFPTVLSFPSKWRLFELIYGYKTSCNACHIDGGGTENNDYGMAYHRKGENLAAFAAIESLDSDRDGAANIDEIKAKSNPGDPRSTPKNPGDFLSQQEGEYIPKKILDELFSVPVSFHISYATLDSVETKDMEKRVGLRPTEDERVPTFYRVFSSGSSSRKIGTAVLFFEMENHRHLLGGVACDTLGKITKLAIFKQQVKKGLPLSEFNAQFAGKTAKEQFKIGQDLKPIPNYPTFSQKVADYVKKSVYLITQFGTKS